MSQSGLLRITTGVLPPSVPLQFNTDINSPSIPAANIENVIGSQVNDNNVAGIQTDGSSGGNTITVELTNRLFGTATTSDAVTPITVYTFALPTDGTYLFTTQVVGYDITSNLSAAYASYRTVRVTGGVAFLISAQTSFETEEAGLAAAVVSNGIIGNSVNLTVVGVAGQIIHWRALTTYLFVG